MKAGGSLAHEWSEEAGLVLFDKAIRVPYILMLLSNSEELAIWTP